jgi:hypothetical protein
MIVNSEEDVRRIVESDEWMMQVLSAAAVLNLPDWWICAGFLRNKIWNSIEGLDQHSITDVDLVYFDSSDLNPETDWAYDKKMKREYPTADWEIRNQARMHYVNNFEPYISTADGISHWVETATCTAVKLEDNNLKFLFCHGSNDLLNLIARPIPIFQTDEMIGIFHNRIKTKAWKKKWPNLKVEIK